MTTEQFDGFVEDAMRRLLVVHRQDQCAAGFHAYEPWPGGFRRCYCGKAEDIDNDPFPALLDRYIAGRAGESTEGPQDAPAPGTEGPR